MLVAQALEGPLGRRTLPSRHAQVRLQDRVNHRQQWTQIRLFYRLRSREARKAARTGTSSQSSRGSDQHQSHLPTAVPLVEHTIPNRRVDLHGEHRRQPQNGSAYPVDGFVTAANCDTTGFSRLPIERLDMIA